MAPPGSSRHHSRQEVSGDPYPHHDYPVGIVHVTDSNLSDDRGYTDQGKKAFECDRLPAGVACAGAYSVAGEPMDRWLTARISEYEADGLGTVAGLADWLRRCVEHSMTPDEKRAGCWLHVTGYARDRIGWHPEIYRITNVPGLDAEGDYLPSEQVFRPLEEEYWTKGGATLQGRSLLASKHPLFVDGFPDGRKAYGWLVDELENFLDSIWSRTDWQFRPPRTLTDCAIHLSLHLAVVDHLFRMSGYGPIVGGPPQKVLIAPPAP